MDGKMEGFLKEYETFKQYAGDKAITGSEAETIQLFAIFRKDERANGIMERKNGIFKQAAKNDEQPATDKQKSYIKDIYTQNGIRFSEQDMDNLTKKQASDIINSFRGGAD